MFLLCVAVRVSWSDDFDEGDSIRPTRKQPTVKSATPGSDSSELRQRLVELMSQRAERMSVLEEEIDQLGVRVTDAHSVRAA